MSYQIGIDLGTSNCCVAVFKNDAPEIIEDTEGHRTIPSYVSFTDSGVLVGHAAKARAHVDPKNTVYNVLLLVGKRRNEVLHYLQKLPYDVIENADGKLKIKVRFGGTGNDAFFPEEIISLFISHLKHIASKYLGKPVTGAVISYPHSFNLLQIQSLRIAATTAGLTDIHLSSSSALAALAYGYQNNLYRLDGKKEISLLVFNMGGGSTEAAYIKSKGSVYSVMEAKSSFSCGGTDVTDAIISYFTKELMKCSIDISSDVSLKLKFYSECEKVKKVLSSASVAHLELDVLLPVGRRKDKLTLSRDEFDVICNDVFMGAVEVVKDALQDTDSLTIDQCILTGSSSRIPRLQWMISKLFCKPLSKSVNLDEAVAYGAALQAANMSGHARHYVLKEVVANSIGLELINGKVESIIPRGTQYPSKHSTVFSHSTPGTLDPIQFRIYEGEHLETRGNKLIGLSEVRCSTAVDIKVSLIYTPLNTLAIEVIDTKHSVCLLKQDNVCTRLHSGEEMDFMKVRLISFEEQLQRKFECAEAKNSFEEYVITIKDEISNGRLVGEDAREVMSKRDEFLEQIEGIGNAYEVKMLQLKLQHLYEDKCDHAVKPPNPNEVMM